MRFDQSTVPNLSPRKNKKAARHTPNRLVKNPKLNSRLQPAQRAPPDER
jgi:hypothetical protein